MTTVATENCATYLVTHGMNISDILVSKPTVPMRTLCLTSFKIGKDVACQTDTSNTSSEDWFEEFLEEMNFTETVLDTCLTDVINFDGKQMAKDESLNPCKPKISSKPVQNFVKCSHLNLPPFLCPRNCPALFVGCASTFIICRPTKRSFANLRT